MPCYHPVQAFQSLDGSIAFVERLGSDVVRQLQLPCGQCLGCRLERSRQWAMRCVHESSLHDSNCFITLTYDDAHLPRRGFLVYPHFQAFMKRLRFHFKLPIRFYMCGEYGTNTWRPHYHSCLFGCDFPDKTYWRTTTAGSKSYRSAILERLWTFGHSEVGQLNFESAAYAARYCVQKVTGWNAQFHYARQDENGPYSLPPEFNHMSLKPGIGARFFDKWKSDIYPHDYVIVRGMKMRPPKYYDRRYQNGNPDEFEELQFRRELHGRALYSDNTPSRLVVKEAVAERRLAFFTERGSC